MVSSYSQSAYNAYSPLRDGTERPTPQLASNWKLARMSRNGGSVIFRGRVLRFKPNDLFLAHNDDARTHTGVCVGGDYITACFRKKIDTSGGDINDGGRCFLNGTSGPTCFAIPYTLCCNDNKCPA